MRIKEYRIINGYTQRELAEVLGIKQNTYSDKERGKINFTIDEIKIIKELFNTTYDDLLS